ncbi:MAG: ATP-binding cassette domain-containing protein, partial [Chloroflexi bacterium]|nr:ATP-binding cassette domain-containing protein [Chloroflexota bacterium]
MLRVEGLGVRFGRAWVLRGVSFSLEKGQSLAVTGRNGAGKSTL